MIMVMDYDDKVEDLCYLVNKKFKKVAPCSLIGQVNTYIAQNYAEEEANKHWSFIIDESLRYAVKIVNETGYEREFDQSASLEKRLKAIEDKDNELKTKMSKILESSAEVRDHNAQQRRGVRVSCLEQTEQKVVTETTDNNFEALLSVLNTPTFDSYLSQQRDKSFQKRKEKPKSNIKLPEYPNSEPKYKTQGEVINYIESIKSEPCFLHAAGGEVHKLWECGMRITNKMEVLLAINHCRKCFQPGHVGNNCPVMFIPVCEVCGSIGHLQILCKIWLKEKAKDYRDLKEAGTSKYDEQRELAKIHSKPDPKITELHSNKLEVCREYKPTVSFVERSQEDIKKPNPSDPIALND
jgi:hypothetical protein